METPTSLAAWFHDQELSNGQFSIKDILDWSENVLERRHDWVQWAFPNRVPSQFNPFAPLADDSFFSFVKNDNQSKANIALLTLKMMWFYSVTNQWLSESDHNHLRITRILKFLREADPLIRNLFYEFITERVHGTAVNELTLNFWKNA